MLRQQRRPSYLHRSISNFAATSQQHRSRSRRLCGLFGASVLHLWDDISEHGLRYWWQQEVKRAFQGRSSLPSERGLSTAQKALLAEPGVDKPPPSKLMMVRDVLWTIVHGKFEHQMWETAVCFALLIFAALQCARHVNEDWQLASVQHSYAVDLAYFWIAEVVIKAISYDLLGLLSSARDRAICLLAALSTAGLLVVLYDEQLRAEYDFDPAEMSSTLGERPSLSRTTYELCLTVPTVLMLFVRLPLLLLNWRYCRTILQVHRALVNTLRTAIPAMSNVMCLYLLLGYMYTVLGTLLWADVVPARFGGLGTSFFTILQVITGDWSDVMAECLHDADGEITEISTIVATVFFATLVIVNYILRNLLLSCFILNGMSTYLQLGLIVSAMRMHVVMKAKRKLMRAVHRLRDRKRHASNTRAAMMDEKVTPGWAQEVLDCMPLPFRTEMTGSFSLKDTPAGASSPRQKVADASSAAHDGRPNEAMMGRVEELIAHLPLEQAAQLLLQSVFEAALLSSKPASFAADSSWDEGEFVRRRAEAMTRCECLLRSHRRLLGTGELGPTWHVSGDSAVHCAAFFGDAELTLLLLSHGARPMSENASGKTALARRSLASSTSSSMMTMSADVGWKGSTGGGGSRRHVDPQALLELAAWNSPLHYLLIGSKQKDRGGGSGQPEDAEEALRREQRRLMTLELLLWPKAFLSGEDGAQRHIMLGADPGKPNEQGETPLHLAARLGDLAVTEKLLLWDDDLLQQRSQMLASSSRLGKEASLVNLYNECNGRTPLHEALLRACELLHMIERERTEADEQAARQVARQLAAPPPSPCLPCSPNLLLLPILRSLPKPFSLASAPTPQCLEVAHRLLSVKHLEPSRCVLMFSPTVEHTPGTLRKGLFAGGSSALLLLLNLTALGELDASSHTLAIHRREQLQSLLELAYQMQMDLAESLGSISAVQLFDQAVLPFGARVFSSGKRASCIEVRAEPLHIYRPSFCDPTARALPPTPHPN